jgi:hypothetical protein
MLVTGNDRRLAQLSLEEGAQKVGMICTVMEAAKGMLYRLPCQARLSSELLSTPAAGRIVLNHTTALKSHIARQVRILVNPCLFFLDLQKTLLRRCFPSKAGETSSEREF